MSEIKQAARFGGQDLATRFLPVAARDGEGSRSMNVFFTTQSPAKASRGWSSSKAKGAGLQSLRPSGAMACAHVVIRAGMLYKLSAIAQTLADKTTTYAA